MSDLVTFLRARLDEDEAAAKAYVPVAGHTHRHAEGGGWREHNHMGGGVPHQHDPDTGFQIPAPTVGDPARVLREVAAKRAILDFGSEDPLCMVERYLAAVYSDHPDYRPAWKP